MKQLLLIRHAKSDWNDPTLADFDRPLNDRGCRDAPVMAERLAREHITPQAIVTSPALRAITTANHFADRFGIDKQLIKTELAIYEASTANLLSVVNNFDNQYDFVALFGHNPGLTNFVISLCDTDVYDIPTCGMVLIQFPFDDWRMISKNTGEQLLYDFPKNED